MIVAYAREARNALKRFADVVTMNGSSTWCILHIQYLSLGVSGLTE